jgi:hypothetical protein
MSKRHSPWFLAVSLLFCGAVWGQDNSAQQPASTAPDANPQQPVPAYGPDNPAAPSISDNPPISGLDLPNLQPHAAPLSYLQPGAHVSESIDSNIGNTLGGSEVNSITRAEGSLELRRLWSHYDLSLNYLGGVGYYNVRGTRLVQIQELGFYQKVTWKRGQLGVRDAFSYQPEGAFGSAYGAVGALGAGLNGIGGFLGGSALGDLGQVPRIMNLGVVDAVESLSPRSSLTATVGYSFVHFLKDEPGTGSSFIGDSQVSGELGYSRILGLHDQGAVLYGYQNFQFSSGVAVHANLIQLMWGHRISGRMDFLAAAGPEFTEIDHVLTPVTSIPSSPSPTVCVLASATIECPTNDLRIGAAGQARLRYQFPRVSLTASYEHFLSNGSGFFAGAETDVVSLAASRPLGRIWNVTTDLGYSRNSRATPNTCSGLTQNCSGVSANVFQYGYAGVNFHRMFGRNFHGFVSYQFNKLLFDNSFCGTALDCNRTTARQIGTIGLDWTPRPTRLD